MQRRVPAHSVPDAMTWGKPRFLCVPVCATVQREVVALRSRRFHCALSKAYSLMISRQRAQRSQAWAAAAVAACPAPSTGGLGLRRFGRLQARPRGPTCCSRPHPPSPAPLPRNGSLLPYWRCQLLCHSRCAWSYRHRRTRGVSALLSRLSLVGSRWGWEASSESV